jgi:hypothetical protein
MSTSINKKTNCKTMTQPSAIQRWTVVSTTRRSTRRLAAGQWICRWATGQQTHRSAVGQWTPRSAAGRWRPRSTVGWWRPRPATGQRTRGLPVGGSGTGQRLRAPQRSTNKQDGYHHDHQQKEEGYIKHEDQGLQNKDKGRPARARRRRWGTRQR